MVPINWRQVGLLWLSFWLPSLVVLLLDRGIWTGIGEVIIHQLPLQQIIIRNEFVLACILICKYLLPYLGYGIFYLNAISFSISLAASTSPLGYFWIAMVYGCLEVLALSIACAYHKGMDKRYISIAVITMGLAALIEVSIMKGSL